MSGSFWESILGTTVDHEVPTPGNTDSLTQKKGRTAAILHWQAQGQGNLHWSKWLHTSLGMQSQSNLALEFVSGGIQVRVKEGKN